MNHFSGFESKAASLMSLESTSNSKKLFRMQPKRRKKQNRKDEIKKDAEQKMKKNNAKRQPKHSFFTNIPKDCADKITTYLQTQGFMEDPSLSSPYYLVIVNADDGRECDIIYDSAFNPKSIRSPKLRWFVADVKRLWQERFSIPDDNSADANMLNGSECDFR